MPADCCRRTNHPGPAREAPAKSYKWRHARRLNRHWVLAERPGM